VISRGPGADDVLSEPRAALFFEPEDAAELAAMLRRAWDDASLRREIAENGARYADALGGEKRLLRDILRVALADRTALENPSQAEALAKRAK
jgi:hypothetical protein